MEEEKTIYNMKLHELMEAPGFAILKVPGGWIYFDKGNQLSNFIPFDNEFDK